MVHAHPDPMVSDSGLAAAAAVEYLAPRHANDKGSSEGPSAGSTGALQSSRGQEPGRPEIEKEKKERKETKPVCRGRQRRERLKK